MVLAARLAPRVIVGLRRMVIDVRHRMATVARLANTVRRVPLAIIVRRVLKVIAARQALAEIAVSNATTVAAMAPVAGVLRANSKPVPAGKALPPACPA